MKKLMIAAAIVCAAGFSQAATVSWGVKSTMTPDATGAFTSTGVGGNANMSVFLVDSYNDGKDTWFIANKADAVIAEFDGELVNAEISLLNTKRGGQGGVFSGDAITGWTKVESVPEPTSGLLLLLGVAGLALRRRRA